MSQQYSRSPNYARSGGSRSRRRLLPFLVLIVVIVIAVLALLANHFLAARADNSQTSSLQATIAALRTEVAVQRRQATARQTQVAQQQRTIAQLQHMVQQQQTPTGGPNGTSSYIASFQIDKYSYILFMQWQEASGFVRNGRLLTTDNYQPKASKSFTFTGLDNAGSIGFTGHDGNATMTFTGTRNSDGTFTVSGLPWKIFTGFVGGTFSQKLHQGTMEDYHNAVANLPGPPQ